VYSPRSSLGLHLQDNPMLIVDALKSREENTAEPDARADGISD
jgi:hypothetical protein